MSSEPTSTGIERALPAPTYRADWVDVARTLGMYFIMWLHVRNAPSCIHGAVEGGIGLFFLLAGYFMPRDATRTFKRALEQLRAWVMWMIIPSVLYVLIGMDWEWQRGLGWGVAAYNAPLWFLRNLVIFQVIMAGLMVLRFLPGNGAVLATMLAAFGYIIEWPEHTVIRFDWMMTLALGFALRAIPLQDIYGYIKKNSLILALPCLLVIVQTRLIAIFARQADWSYKSPIAPIHSLAYILLFFIVGIFIAERFPRLTRVLATVGRCMMFIYVSHSILYGLIIVVEVMLLGGTILDGPWHPVIAMALLCPLCLWLQARYPRLMNWLGCPAPKKKMITTHSQAT